MSEQKTEEIKEKTEEPQTDTVEVENVETVETIEVRKPASLDLHVEIGQFPSGFRETLKILEAMDIGEVTLRFKGGNLDICQMDTSRVALVRATYNLGLDHFTDEVSFAVNVRELRNVLKRFENPHFRIDGNKLIAEDKDITVSDNIIRVTPKRFETLILEPEVDTDMDSIDASLGKLEHTVKAEVDFDKVWKYVKVFGSPKNIPDVARFTAENGSLKVSFVGKTNSLTLDIGENVEGEGKVSISTLFLSALKGKWKVAFSNDQPLKAYDSFSQITVYIAPRIEVD